MTAPQNPRVTAADDPERIYLQPQGCFDPQGYDGRLWCEDPIWPDECGCDCPFPKASVSYIREDIAKAAEVASKAREAALVELVSEAVVILDNANGVTDEVRFDYVTRAVAALTKEPDA